MLDACFQSVGAHLLIGGRRDGGLLLPLSIGLLRRFGAGRDARYCHVTVTKADAAAIEADLEVLDGNGDVVLEVSRLRMGSGATKAGERERVLADRLLTVAWEPQQPPVPVDGATAGSWLLISSGDAAASPRDDLPTDLADALVARGAHCRTASSLADADGVTGVVIVTAPADGDPNEGCLTRGRELVAHIVHIARELTVGWSEGGGEAPRLYVITRNAQSVALHDRVNLDQGGVRGLVRVIGAEHAPLRPTQIDVDPGTTADQLAQELLTGSDEDETAWRAGSWYAARLRRTPLGAEERRTTLADPESDNMRLQVRTPGDLQTLELVAAERPAPAAGQVEVAVGASSINFADVLAAFGRYPTFDGKQPQLGLDFAGVITAVGPGVTEHRVGDQVGGFGADGCWGTYVTCDARLVAALPAGLTAEQAAAISTGYGTAWYSLCDLARIGPGDRVLIHSATGGVGQAAIAIARHAGAEIFATAGSPGRRQLLRDIGIEHVYDSRSTDFADEIRRDTDGYGVDVVLNSLIGPAQRAGLELLAFGGRFVEIGKRDVYEHTRVDLYPFRKNLTFYYADLALMTTGDPKRIGTLLRKVYGLVGDGVLPVPEHTAHPLTEAATAIRAISAAEHTGKLVLSVPRRGSTRVAVPPNRAPVFRADGSYLVTGGVGGLGLFLAAVMASGGCGRIVLTSRSQPNPQAQKMIARLRKNGTDIVVESGNIADPQTAARLVSVATATGLPLRGILHAAGVVDDATLDNITDELIDRDWAPKVHGAWYLHQAAADQPLDWFCNFSSAAVLLGSPGQGAYAAANSWLDSLHVMATQPRGSGHRDRLGRVGRHRPRRRCGTARRRDDDQSGRRRLRVPGAAASRPGIHRLPAADRNAVVDRAGRAQPIRRGIPRLREPPDRRRPHRAGRAGRAGPGRVAEPAATSGHRPGRPDPAAGGRSGSFVRRSRSGLPGHPGVAHPHRDADGYPPHAQDHRQLQHTAGAGRASDRHPRGKLRVAVGRRSSAQQPPGHCDRRSPWQQPGEHARDEGIGDAVDEAGFTAGQSSHRGVDDLLRSASDRQGGGA